MSLIQSLKNAMSTIAAAEKAQPGVTASLLSDAGLEKAAMGMGAAAKVDDLWTEGEFTKVPNREQINTGPSESASGSGAEKMVREYSSPAAQHGIQLMAEKLAAMLAPIAASSKATNERLRQQTEAIFDLATAVKSSIPTPVSPMILAEAVIGKADDDDKEKEEKEEVTEANSKACKAALSDAADLVRKAAALEAALAGETDVALINTVKGQVTAMRKAAGRLLAKARNAAYAAGNDEMKKAVRKAIAKSDITVVEDDEDDDDEAEKAKAKAVIDTLKAEAAAKAKTDDKGNQADRADSASGNQAAASKAPAPAATAVASSIDPISTELAAMKMSINAMMDVVAGKSRAAVVVPDLTKANPQALTSISEKIMLGEDSGALSVADGLAAREILSKIEAAKAGHIDPTVVVDRLAKSSAGVRSLFNDSIQLAA